MDKKDIKQYFNKKEENVDTSIFEIEENEFEVKRMDIKDFKNLAIKAGLLKDDKEESEEEEPDLEKDLAGTFKVVED
jgi:hypothetical protein